MAEGPKRVEVAAAKPSKASTKSAGESLKASVLSIGSSAGDKPPTKQNVSSPQKTYGLKIVHHNFQQGESNMWK